jgi:hypothetical protein
MDYAFAPGVSACLADGRLVILNVPADRYLMLPPDAEASVRRLIDGCPAAPGDDSIRERLCTAGLVLKRVKRGRLQLCEAIEPAQSLVDDGWAPPGNLQSAIAGFRVLEATLNLRWRGLDAVLRSIAAIPAPAEDHIEEVFSVAAAFAELRFLVRALDRCLPLSVALTSAAKRHAEMQLILGVRRDPFCAHAWAQIGTIVLNDRLDTVRSFTPVLAL